MEFSNGIYKVFKSEKKYMSLNIIVLVIVILICSGYVAGITTNFFAQFGYESSKTWTLYIVPSFLILLSLTKLLLILIEMSSLNWTLKKYEQNSIRDEKYAPAFIIRLYKRISLRQVHHNWLTIFFIFYGGLATIFFYLLKDQIWFWGVLNFKKMIHSLFLDPELMTIIFSSIIGFIFFLHILMLIIRKKRLVDIETFFGNDVISESQINDLKSKRNKLLFRIFLLSIAILLVLPIITLLIIRNILKRK